MSSTSVPAIGAAGVGGVAGVAGGAGVGTYDDCQLSALPPCSFFATKAATAASPVTSRIFLSVPLRFFGGGSPLSWATRRRPGHARGGLLGGEARPVEAFSAASAAPAARIGAALSRASAISWPAFSRASAGPVRPCRGRRRAAGWRGPWPPWRRPSRRRRRSRPQPPPGDGRSPRSRAWSMRFFLRRPMGVTLPSRRVASIRSCPIGPGQRPCLGVHARIGGART